MLLLSNLKNILVKNISEKRYEFKANNERANSIPNKIKKNILKISLKFIDTRESGSK